MHDTTAARAERIDTLLHGHLQVRALVDAEYQGLAKEHQRVRNTGEQGQCAITETTRRRCASPGRLSGKAERREQSSRRIPVEHAIVELKWWRQLQRFTGSPPAFQ